MGYRPPREHGPVRCRIAVVRCRCGAKSGRRTRARAPLPGRSRRREGKSPGAGRSPLPLQVARLPSSPQLNSTQLNSTQLNSPLNAYPPRYTTRFGVGHARSSPRYYPTCGVRAQSERACAREYWCTKMPAASGLLASLSMDPSEPRCGVTRPTMGSNVLLTKTGLSKVRYISP